MPDDYAADMMRKRALTGLWDGKTQTPYFAGCRWYWPKYEVSVILTRDVNHHLGGWWKNPQYEQCWPLSLANQSESGQPGAKNESNTLKILKAVFADEIKNIWSEPPFTEQGKRFEIWHYRLFCDMAWIPFKPKGEVYSTELTERGFLTYSELQNHYEQARKDKG